MCLSFTVITEKGVQRTETVVSLRLPGYLKYSCGYNPQVVEGDN